jgi:hypothetical protein
MRKTVFVIFFLLLSFFPVGKHSLYGNATYHPVHVSYTNVAYLKDKKQFRILFKIFVDDFDRILQKKYNAALKLEKGEKPEGHELIITKYILEHFKIIIDNKDYTASRLKFLKLELKEKAIWLHYSYKFNGKSNNFELWNSLMTDLYPDQTNLLIFDFNNLQEAIRFTNKKTKEVLSVK